MGKSRNSPRYLHIALQTRRRRFCNTKSEWVSLVEGESILFFGRVRDDRVIDTGVTVLSVVRIFDRVAKMQQRPDELCRVPPQFKRWGIGHKSDADAMKTVSLCLHFIDLRPFQRLAEAFRFAKTRLGNKRGHKAVPKAVSAICRCLPDGGHC